MPWSQVSPMDSRQQFIAEYLTGLYSVTELAVSYGISRRIANYLITRYERDGPAGLLPASRRPHTSPAATPRALVDRICAARSAHPTWGAGKLRDYLCSQAPEPTVAVPNTFHEILHRRGLVRQRVRRRPTIHPPVHLTPPTTPNLVWTTDYKGEFRLRDGTWCYPFTLRDGCARFVLRCTALPCHTRAATEAEFRAAFRAYGLPDRIGSDNGSPFASPGLGRLSRLAVWWIRLGIIPSGSRLGIRNKTGRTSNSTRSLNVYDPAAGPALPSAAAPLLSLRRRIQPRTSPRRARWTHACGCLSVLAPSVPGKRLPPVQYPAAWMVRRVSAAGAISWRGRLIFLTEIPAGEQVALEPIDDVRHLLRFHTLGLARFDERRGLVLPPVPASAISAGSKCRPGYDGVD